MTIVAPRRRIDLSLPADVPLAHMLPTLLRAAGENLADAGLAHSGWALQRLDDAPLDPAQSLAALKVMDGEVLYFRPRMAQLPEMSFDDVADVIATGIKERSDRWRPHSTRSAGLWGGAGLLGAGGVALALSGPPWAVPAVAAGLVALVLLVAGAMMSRAMGDAGAGAVMGYVAVPYAFLAGLLIPARETVPSVFRVGAPHMLAGFGAASLAAIVGGAVIAEGLPNFLGIALAALTGTIGAGVVVALPGTPPAGAAAACVAVVVALTALIPSLAFKLARLPLPAVPSSAEELRGDTSLVNGKAVLERTAVADKFATGLVAGAALVAIGTEAFLSAEGGWLAVSMGLAISLALILRARVFRGRLQRVWMFLAGLAGVGVLALGAIEPHEPVTTLAGVVLPLVGATIMTVGLGLWLPGNRPSPFWGRAGDILDIIVVVSLIPLALGVLDLYTWIRGQTG
ncbi:MAG TPA: type VII secretion integral membrane protein EccD [Streptosporangiaceae bacterium]